MPIRRVLVANRGEIAVRIIRACRDLSIETVQVYSTADKDSLPVRLADKSVCIGAGPATESYLRAGTIIEAAAMSEADAIHPGYGFLSENAEFADLCARAGLMFIGPSASVIRLMGDKAAARRAADEAGVPVTPGSPNPISDPEEAKAVAARIGYPVLIKASAGGGGRGMRVVNDESALGEMLERASAEATSAFGNGEVYIEKYLARVRHIEVQVMGDGQRVVHFGERDCSIQRRHQKLVEESPSSALSPSLREAMTSAACRLTSRVGYQGAGTIEFIADADSDNFYFIEMNTRIQVEHPITEAVTGYDLVKMQIVVADTGRLPIEQSDVGFSGHAIECRINSEDPARGFMPKPGRLTEFTLPAGPGVRVDTHAFTGYELPPHYDSLLAKVITWGRTREEALARMRRALAEMVVTGVPSTTGFHQRLLSEPDFVAGRVHTRFVRDTMWAGHPMQHLL
jgi:acetyl-CoA carboxylase, biotin carboxylase subunit